MTGRDDWELPITGPDGQPVTYGMARACARGVLGRAETSVDEQMLARLVLALVMEVEETDPGRWDWPGRLEP